LKGQKKDQVFSSAVYLHFSQGTRRLEKNSCRNKLIVLVNHEQSPMCCTYSVLGLFL